MSDPDPAVLKLNLVDVMLRPSLDGGQACLIAFIRQ